jgi:hypothetical protein
MNKRTLGFVSLAAVVVFFAACAKAPSIPVAGSAKPVDMLTLIPKDVQGVFVIDVHRMMATDFANKAIKDNKDYQKYKETIDAIGLDPQKDIYFAAVGLAQKAGQKDPDAVAVVNLKYDQAKIVAKMKEKTPELIETQYEGVSLFAVPEEGGGEMVYGAFIDASNIAIGKESTVKAAVDVLKGKAESAVKNAGLMSLVKTANKTAMVWSVFAFSPEQVKEMVGSNPMLGSLEGLKALSIFLDYKNAALDVELKAMTTDAAKNKEIAELLTGLKAMGGMISGEKPEIGEVLNAITISSAPDHIRISAHLPEALIEKLSAEAQKAAAAKLGLEKPEEKTAEIKK